MHCAFIMFARNGTSVPMPACPRLKEVSKVFRVGMPKKEVEDTGVYLGGSVKYLGALHPQNI